MSCALIDSGRLRFTTSYEEAAGFADVHFIAVGTPQKHGELAAELRYVDAVVESLAPLLPPGDDLGEVDGPSRYGGEVGCASARVGARR